MNERIIRLLVVDFQTIVRQGLVALIQGALGERVEIVGQASNGREAVEMVRRLCPDVVLMEYALPKLNGSEAVRQMMRIELRNPPHCLMISARFSMVYVEKAMKDGAAGFFLKSEGADRLVYAINEVARGNCYFSPEVARKLRDYSRVALQQLELEYEERKARIKKELTVREAEILQLIAESYTYKEIAHELGNRYKTVCKLALSMKEKIGCRNESDVVRYAHEKGYAFEWLPGATHSQ